MIVKLLNEHHLELLSLKGGCRGSSESTHVKMSNCWKSHALAQMLFSLCTGLIALTLFTKSKYNSNLFAKFSIEDIVEDEVC